MTITAIANTKAIPPQSLPGPACWVKATFTSPALEQVTILTHQRPVLAVVDCGICDLFEGKIRVLISVMRRSLTPKLIAEPRRRSAIETEIGHMKTAGRMSRSPLQGTLGDAVFAVLCARGNNIRKIFAHLRALPASIIVTILTDIDIYRRDLQVIRAARKPYSEPTPRFPAQVQEPTLRPLYYCSVGVRGRGAPVTYLYHLVSLDSDERIAPSSHGIKYLVVLR